MITQYGRVEEIRQQWSTPAAGAGPQTFKMTFPAKGGPRNCSVAGCPGRVATRMAMRVHFLHQHVFDTVVILEEVNFPHPRCAQCDMMVPRRSLNGRHPAMAQCERGAERKRKRLVEADTRESLERAFEGYGEPIKNVSEFRYLGRVLTVGDDDWLAVVGNLGKVRKSWGRLSQVLVWEGADPKVSEGFYKSVAQVVLLFGAETWVLTQRMEKSMDSFQSRFARRLTGEQPWRKKDRIWDYLPLVEALGEVGIEGIRKSITWRQNTVAQYIAT